MCIFASHINVHQRAQAVNAHPTSAAQKYPSRDRSTLCPCHSRARVRALDGTVPGGRDGRCTKLIKLSLHSANFTTEEYFTCQQLRPTPSRLYGVCSQGHQSAPWGQFIAAAPHPAGRAGAFLLDRLAGNFLPCLQLLHRGSTNYRVYCYQILHNIS